MKTENKLFINNAACLIPQRFLLAALLVLAVALVACESPEDRAQNYVAKADQFLADGNLVKAEIEAKNALQIEPQNAEARYALARVAEGRSDFGDMAANLRAAVEFRPEFLEARLKLGTIYALGGATELAEEQLAAVEKFAAEDSGTRLLRARLMAARGDLEGARKELEAVVELQPDNNEALGLFANVTAASDVDAAIAIVDGAIAKATDNRLLRLLKIQLLQRGGDEAAVEAEYRTLIDEYPDEVAYSYQLARFLASAGKPDEVEVVLQGVIDRDPENQQAKLALVQFVSGIKGNAAGRELFQSFLQKNPQAGELRMVLARQYQLDDDNDKSIAEYKRVIADAGNEDIALVAKSRIAAIRLSQGDLEAGERLIDEVLAVDSMNAEALLLRGALNFDRGELKEAVSDLRSVLRKDPESQQAQMLLARAHAKAKDFLLARDAYRRALQMNPANVRATLELTGILINDQEFDKAESLLREQIAVTPADISVARALISVLVVRKRYDDALAEAVRVTALPGQQAIGEFLSGGIYQVRDQHEQAIEAFRRSLADAPTAREPLQGLVTSLVRLGRSQEAVSYLQQLGRDYPDNLYSKTLLGQVLAGSGDSGAAREVFESALSDNEGWLPAYTALASLNAKDPKAQIDIYKRGLAAVPESQELALLLGTAYERNGQYDAAIDAYTDVLAVNPDMPAVANNLAALLADHHDDSASLDRALQLSLQFDGSENPAFLDTLGWVYYRLGQYGKAQPLLEKAVGAAQSVPVLSYHLGMNYFAQGKTDQARLYLGKAIAKEGDFQGKDDAKNALARIDAGEE